MAYDELLALRIRDLIGDEPDVREQRMFGGLSFLLSDVLALAASGDGGILARVGPDAAAELAASTQAEVAVMGTRRMRGWVRVAGEHLEHDEALEPWVRRSVRFARTLEPSKPRRR